MQQLVEKMVADFERGKLNRRQLVSALAGLVAVGANAASSASDFKTVSLNHVTFRVSDVQRSTKLYQEIFGLPLTKSSPTVNILGVSTNCYIGIEALSGKNPGLDHFSLGIQNFNPKEDAAKLEKRGFKCDVSKDGIKFNDPDGILVQFGAQNYVPSVPK
jgi:catechol 2,3-dioxygenase-like lactoylglutathione lyase family enzyme